MRITLLIPELLWSEPGDTEAHAAALNSPLAKILARCRYTRQPDAGWENTLRRLAGFPEEASLAVLRALGDGVETPESESERWLCADPVHLRFHQDRLVLADAAQLSLDPEALTLLAGRLNQALAGKAEIQFCGPQRGYLRLSQSLTDLTEKTGAASLNTAAGAPLSRKIGREVRPGDFAGNATIRGIANEIQMLLHADPYNQAREAAGLPAVNALWLWGAGQSPRPSERGVKNSIDAVIGTHPLAFGMARKLAVQHLDGQPVKTAYATRSTPRQALFILDALCAPTHYQDVSAYAQAWKRIDADHLTPVLQALRRFHVKQLDLVAPTAFGELSWQIDPVSAWLRSIGGANWQDLLNTLTSQD